jgi:hypothetical protein
MGGGVASRQVWAAKLPEAESYYTDHFTTVNSSVGLTPKTHFAYERWVCASSDRQDDNAHSPKQLVIMGSHVVRSP